MAEMWLALFLVATLGSVNAATTPVTAGTVKTEWEKFKPDQAQTEINECDTSSSCGSTNVDNTATGTLEALCQAVDDYSNCAEGCSLTNDQKQKLESVEDLCKTADLEKAVADITTGGNCDTATCPTTDVDDASDINAKCVEFYTYSSCAKGKCSSTLTAAEKQALKDMEDQCKTAELETALGVIKVKCPECNTEADAVGGAPELDGKCQASEAYLTCLTDKTCTTTVPDSDKEALKTPCKATTGTETTTETAATTVDPFDDVKSMWTTFKNNQNIATNCVDTTCPSTAVENALTKDLDAFCKAIGIYSVCAKANCTSTLTDTQLLDEMTDQCKTASTLGGDDDGCSILQVSTLALMSSLLLSII